MKRLGPASAVVEAHVPVATAGVLLGRSTRWVLARIRAGDLRGYRLDRGFVVSSASINEFLDSCAVHPDRNHAAAPTPKD